MVAVREQLPMGLAYGESKVKFREATAAQNKILPIHRWVPWVAGFSAQFVEDVIDAYLPKQGRSRKLVLDPFAGVGTTLVEALKAGCGTVGYEINAFARLVAHAKVNCIDIEPEVFQTHVDAFRSTMTDFEATIDRRWGEDGDAGISEVLDPLQLSAPAGFRSRIPLFSPAVEAKFLFALKHTASLQDPSYTLFRLALGATMITFSNYSYEPSLSSRPGAGKALIENASVELPVCQKLEAMVEDIRGARTTYGDIWPRRRQVIASSYFDSKLRPRSVSLLITSPPYMNNYHYVRNTRPQLYWLGLVQQPEDLRKNEEESFGKFWQTVRQRDALSLDFDFASLDTLVDRLRVLNVEKGPYGGPGWANYVVSYFNDCNRFLQLVRHQLSPGARAIIVVGNSIVQGIEFKVDQLLAELAEQRGLTVEEVRIVRTKRVGNSIINSSVRNGGDHASKHKTQLYDAAVILRA